MRVDGDKCIGCLDCVDYCPVEAIKEVPSEGVVFIDDEDCVECGCCQYECPAKIPLVHWIRLGKNNVMIEKKKASA